MGYYSTTERKKRSDVCYDTDHDLEIISNVKGHILCSFMFMKNSKQT